MEEKIYNLIVTVDTHDGYRTGMFPVSMKQVNLLIPLFKKLTKQFSYNWAVEDYNISQETKKHYENILSVEEMEILNSYIPKDDYGYMDSITSVKLSPIISEINILN